MHDSLRGKLGDRMGDVLVVRVDVDFGAQEHRPELDEYLDDAESFFLNGGVIELSRGQLS